MSKLSDPHFHDEEAAYAVVEARLWPNGPVCPHCGGVDRIYELKGKTTRIGLRKCGQCRKTFTVKVGTIFEDSHVPMHLWLQAIYLMCASKKGISANQLHRTLGVTLKTAWFMGHRIREAMRSGELAGNTPCPNIAEGRAATLGIGAATVAIGPQGERGLTTTPGRQSLPLASWTMSVWRRIERVAVRPSS